MSKIKKEWQGLHPYRYKSNPKEKVFALAWQELNRNAGNNRPTNIDYLLNIGCNLAPVICSKRDQEVANTIIQWLGSPCGQYFLEGVLDEIS